MWCLGLGKHEDTNCELFSDESDCFFMKRKFLGMVNDGDMVFRLVSDEDIASRLVSDEDMVLALQ